jgi:hypothetical protein
MGWARWALRAHKLDVVALIDALRSMSDAGADRHLYVDGQVDQPLVERGDLALVVELLGGLF